MKQKAVEIAIKMVEEATACVLEDYCNETTEEDMKEVIKSLKELKDTCEQFGT